MSEQPYTDADAAVQAQLAQQAADLGGAQPAAPAVDLSAAHAQQADVDALMAQLQEQQAHLASLLQAAKDANVVAEPAEPSTKLTDYLDHNLPSWVHTLVHLIEGRLSAIEAK